MASWSWMAALTLVAGIASSAAAQEPAPRGPRPPENPGAPSRVDPKQAPAPAPADTYLVNLELRIAGLSAKGCVVEIKPAHAACSFEGTTARVDARGKVDLKFENVKTRSADRDCTFAITIKEPGHADRTIRRGMRLAADDAPNRAAPQVLTCYLASPSTIARTTGDGGTTTKR